MVGCCQRTIHPTVFDMFIFRKPIHRHTHSSSSSNKQTQTSGRRHHGDRSRAQQQLSCDARCYWSITLFTFHAMAERRLIFDHCSIIESHTSNTWASREYARRRWLYRFLARTWSIVVYKSHWTDLIAKDHSTIINQWFCHFDVHKTLDRDSVHCTAPSHWQNNYLLFSRRKDKADSLQCNSHNSLKSQKRRKTTRKWKISLKNRTTARSNVDFTGAMN